MRFSKNESFNLNGKNIRILDLLGEGGQGEVYLVTDGTNQFAFKYYKEIPSSDFKYNLRNNIAKGAPSNNFLWPKKYIEFEDDSCGYLMDLRGKNYSSFVSYLTGKTRFKSTKVMLNWCIELVQSFKSLHEKGYSYQDLNDGSFFLDPDTGALLICDNDNVTADKRNLGILGKMRYMAPEIVRGDMDSYTGERQMPDTHSDRFSLAVILFLAFCLGNPFEGECLKKYIIIDEKAEYAMFGESPVYIYDEFNKSNRPIDGQKTQVSQFGLGLTDRENSRTTEIEWLRLLCKWRDEIITCSCGKEYIYGFNEKKQNEKCPYCKKKTRSFCYLHVGKNKIILEPNKYLYKIHIDKYSNEYNMQIAKIIQNKKNPSLWGIELRLDNEVYIKDKDGKEKVIKKDGVVPIVANLKIKFKEDAIAEIKTND